MAQTPKAKRRSETTETMMLAETRKDSEWVVKEWDRLKKKYGNRFIAVLERKVIAHHPDMRSLMKIVDIKVPNKKNYVTTEFIGLKEVRWIR